MVTSRVRPEVHIGQDTAEHRTLSTVRAYSVHLNTMCSGDTRQLVLHIDTVLPPAVVILISS
jgi:hypothetical protein